MTSTGDVMDRVRRFCHEELGWPEDAGGDDGPDLVDAGLLDSIGVLRLVDLLEALGVPVSSDELVPENFTTFQAITGIVERTRATRGDGSHA